MRAHVKINNHVSFETLLLLDQDAAYDLRSVLVHHGDQPGGGHYTSYVRAQDNFWYHCDDRDERPRRSATEEVLAARAYMLFYEKR